ncbi:MAG: hypothetical protein FWD23_05715 [Oscillospiraceae bacterium]|nr:hypothetical protein [Oscillospiraceae bacterium]
MVKKSVSKAISFAVIALMLCGMFSFGVSAANPVVIDFSKYDWADDVFDSASGGDGEFEAKADGDKWVIFAECVSGYEPDDDPEGTGTKGDLYTSITGFGDLGVDADVYQWIALGIKNPSDAPGFEIHFSSPTKGYHVESSITFDINPKSDYTKYVYNMTDQCKKYYPKRPADVGDPDVYPDHWHGAIDQFRLDFMYYEESGGHAKTGDTIYLEYIAFFDSEQAANDFVFAPARTAASIQAAKDEAAAAKAAETTEAPAPPPETKAPEAETEAPAPAEGETTAAASSSDGEDSNNMMLIIIIAAAAAVVVIIIVVVIVSGKGKGKESKK